MLSEQESRRPEEVKRSLTELDQQRLHDFKLAEGDHRRHPSSHQSSDFASALLFGSARPMELPVELCDISESQGREVGCTLVGAEQPGGLANDAAVTEIACTVLCEVGKRRSDCRRRDKLTLR